MKRLLPSIAMAALTGLTMAADTPDWFTPHPILLHRAFGVAAWQWIGLLVVGVIAFLVSLVGRYVAMLAIRAREKFIHGAMSPAVRKPIRRAVAVLVFAWTYYALQGELYLAPHPAIVVGKCLDALHALGFILLGCAIWETITEEAAIRTAGKSARAEKLLIPLASKLVRATIIFTGILIAAADIGNVNIPALVTSLGIGGLVIALAAKDSIENIFGSVTILFDMPFALGDWVRIDKVEGVVEEINLRSTRVRTFEDTVITLPNANLIRAAVENYGARRVRRQKLSIRLSSDNSPQSVGKMRQAIYDYLTSKDYVQAERVVVALDSVDDAAMGLFVQCHFEAPTQVEEMQYRNALLTEILHERDRCHVLLAGESRAAQDARQGKR